jgi:two-component system sensor histidine kinase RpfC
MSRNFGELSNKLNRLSFATARDADIEQAWLRVGIGLLAFGYSWFLVASDGLFTPGLIASLVASGGAAIVGIWMIRRLRKSKSHAVPLRYLAIISDVAAITIGMAGADEGGVPFVGVYLWVTVGNGFRFGPRYLLASYWLSLVGYAYLLFFVPFWVQHRAFAVGLLVVLGIVPLYVLVLLTRLTAQKDAAEQLSNAKSRFVANVSHELRTPLTGVSAVYDLLRSRKMTADDRELVGMLGSAVGTLKASVDAVLLMSKLEAGSESVELRPFNLWYFLHQLAALVRPQSIAKGLAWQLHLDPAVPDTVIGDQNHLSHVLGNLLNNAFKFTTTGSVTLRVAVVDSAQVRFEVIDTGLGIPLDQQERLFERFVQVDTSATRRHGGTGLGTSIARDLVDLMGGSIGVVSAPGQGSTFWVELPLAAVATDSIFLRQEIDWGARRQVLVVSAEDAQAQGIATSIASLGLDPVVIASALKAPQSFDAERVLAAILVMPASDAAAYVESALREHGEADCPWLVAASGYTPMQRAGLVRGGVAALLPATVAPQALKARLSALRDRLESIAAAPLQAVVSDAAARSLTVLLADDNPSNQFLLSKILSDAGHVVRTADSGGASFDAMAAGGLDLAILDLNMPDMSGPDVVKLFRASSVGGEKLPIMILSADATPAARRESLEAGADEFLTKPVVAAQLVAAIDRLIAGAAARSEATSPGIPEHPHESPPPTSLVLVDAERLNALRRIARGDAQFLDRYLQAAFEEIEHAISDLRNVGRHDGGHSLRDALHIIEGTGASIGAAALVANCRAMRDCHVAQSEAEQITGLAELSTTYALTKSTVLSNIQHSRDKAVGDRAARN